MAELRVIVSEETAERLAAQAAERSSSTEDVAAQLLEDHVTPSPRARSLPLIAMFDAPPEYHVQRAEEELEAEGFVASS